jgi:hypothetical protein
VIGMEQPHFTETELNFIAIIVEHTSAPSGISIKRKMARIDTRRRSDLPYPTRLSFSYINHRGELHSYLVEPIELDFGPCQCFPDDPDRPVWHIRANVIERDHEPRPGERSFALIKMSHEIQEAAA